MSDIKVLRTFFIDRKVDATVARLALGQAISKNEMMRSLLEDGMARLPADAANSPVDAPQASPDFDDGGDRSKVLRSIYLSPDFDEAMRIAAFDSRTSKSALMRRFIDEGLLAQDGGGPAEVPPVVLVEVEVDTPAIRLVGRARAATPDLRAAGGAWAYSQNKEDPAI